MSGTIYISGQVALIVYNAKPIGDLFCFYYTNCRGLHVSFSIPLPSFTFLFRPPIRQSNHATLRHYWVGVITMSLYLVSRLVEL